MSSEDTTAISDSGASTGSERLVLDTFLDYQRQNIVRKVHGALREQTDGSIGYP
jgi:hypothetical protein